jgi:ribosomal protein S18 acetylase RimI-like enzyme
MPTSPTTSGPTGSTVRPAVAADAAAIADVLARAFHADPVATWVTPDAQRRARVLRRLYAAIVGLDAIPRRTTWVAVRGDAIVAAAVWRTPDRRPSMLAVPFSLRAGRALGRDIPRMTRMGAAVSRARPRVAHWYLQVLGVDPRLQRGGAGSALVSDGLARADAAGLPAYLETTQENIDFYARFGFAVCGEITVAADAPTEFSLLRAPSSRGEPRSPV